MTEEGKGRVLNILLDRLEDIEKRRQKIEKKAEEEGRLNNEFETEQLIKLEDYEAEISLCTSVLRVADQKNITLLGEDDLEDDDWRKGYWRIDGPKGELVFVYEVYKGEENEELGEFEYVIYLNTVNHVLDSIIY